MRLTKHSIIAAVVLGVSIFAIVNLSTKIASADEVNVGGAVSDISQQVIDIKK